MATENQALEPAPECGLEMRLAIALTAALFLVSAAMIFVLVRLLWDLPFGSGTRQLTVSFCNGMLLALPILIALWTVLGTQIAVIRIPIALTVLIALQGAFISALLTMPNSMPNGGAGELILFFSAITLGITFLAHIPLWILKTNGFVLSRNEGDYSKTQFSIKQLMVTTTIFALAISLIQWIATSGSTQRMGNQFDKTMLAFCGILILVLALLAMLCVVIVFLPKLRVWGSILLALSISLIPFAVVPSIRYVSGWPFTWTQLVETGLNVMAFSLANAMTMIVVMTMYYRIGYRLRNTKS